jgi:hypothetical protein
MYFANYPKSIMRHCCPSPLTSNCSVDPSEYEREYIVAEDVVIQMSRCRVMVAGSYHGAIYALAQGIPTVGLFASDVYRNRFLGVADLYERGFEAVLMQGDGFPDRLSHAISYLWERADDLRPYLLEKARTQIEASLGAYHQVFGKPKA